MLCKQLLIATIDVEDVDQFLPLEEVFVGGKADRYLTGEIDLATNEIRGFRERCRQFWQAAVKYAVKKLPVESAFLSSVAWLYPHVHNYGNRNQVQQLASYLPQVIKEDEIPQLGEQFMDYCTSQLPPDFGRESVNEIDTYWYRVGQLKDASGMQLYPLLAKLAKAVLIIPHGNADVERMFSHMGLTKTKLRNCLNVDTLTALLQLQINVKDPCFSFKPTPQMITKCRNAISAVTGSD